MTEEENGKPEESMTTEVVVKPKCRQHSVEYKLRILRELDECSGKGEIGAVLRREGLYSSLVSKWREQREKGSLNGLAGQRRDSKVDPNAAELARLRCENRMWLRRWAKIAECKNIQNVTASSGKIRLDRRSQGASDIVACFVEANIHRRKSSTATMPRFANKPFGCNVDGMNLRRTARHLAAWLCQHS